jgi:hypothetical protein
MLHKIIIGLMMAAAFVITAFTPYHAASLLIVLSMAVYAVSAKRPQSQLKTPR